MIHEISFGLFFLYFVLISNAGYGLLNCGLQRYLNDSILIKHLMVFLSVFLFTFILCWYSLDTLESKFENFQNYSESKMKKYFKNTIIYSIIIYLIFILSTKNEGIFISLFLISCVILLLLNVYLKLKNPKIYNLIIEEYYINHSKKLEYIKKFKDSEDVDLIINIYNSMMIFSVLIILMLIYGSYIYYLKQYKDHKKNWSWIIFWFGSHKGCQGVNY